MLYINYILILVEYYKIKMNIPLDIKLVIASFDMEVWIKLSYIDD